MRCEWREKRWSGSVGAWQREPRYNMCLCCLSPPNSQQQCLFKKQRCCSQPWDDEQGAAQRFEVLAPDQLVI